MIVPVKCPICEGRTKVPPQFYPGDSGSDWKECRACDGKGVIQCWQASPYVPMPYPVPQPYPVYPRPWYPTPQPWIVWDTTVTTTGSGDGIAAGSVAYSGPDVIAVNALND